MLTGGPTLAAVGSTAGARIVAGAARHQVVVTEDHPDLAPERLPMGFDIAYGIYWRPEEGGVMWGMKTPTKRQASPTSSTGRTTTGCGREIEALLPITAQIGLRRIWAATIDYTPDHLPILGPALDASRHSYRWNDRRVGRWPRNDVGSRRLARRRRPGS